MKDRINRLFDYLDSLSAAQIAKYMGIGMGVLLLVGLIASMLG